MDERGWFIESKKKVNISWFDALRTFTYKRPALALFFFFFSLVSLFVCLLFFFLLLMVNCIHVHGEFETLYIFSFAQQRVHIYTCTLLKGHNISISFLFSLSRPSLRKQTRLPRCTKSSWFSHTRRAYPRGHFNVVFL